MMQISHISARLDHNRHQVHLGAPMAFNAGCPIHRFGAEWDSALPKAGGKAQPNRVTCLPPPADTLHYGVAVRSALRWTALPAMFIDRLQSA